VISLLRFVKKETKRKEIFYNENMRNEVLEGRIRKPTDTLLVAIISNK